MPIYRIADLNVLIEPKYKKTEEQLRPYLAMEKSYDFKIEITDDEISKFIEKETVKCGRDMAESTILVNRLYGKIFDEYNGFFFHSSCLMLDGEGYAFSALSGTGKSTHTALWREYFGDRVTMINDDKPIIRKYNEQFYIYGTPWMGKSSIGSNVKAPVKAVYFLKRAKENSAVRVSVGEVFSEILEATIVHRGKENMEKLLTLLDGFFSSVQVFILNCNTDLSAVTVAYEAANN